MIDFSKPIRRRDNKRPARVLATDLPEKFSLCIAWETSSGFWSAYTFPPDTDFIENVPPPQEWRWEDARGYIGSARYESAAEAHSSCRQHAGQPIRILREGETP